jgi:FdhD protein
MKAAKIASVQKVTASDSVHTSDFLAAEEPLEIRLGFLQDSKQVEKNISVTMRTPSNDSELAVGFLFTEGIISSYDQVNDVNSPADNVVLVELKKNVSFDFKKLERNFYTTSSCGVCGKASIDAIRTIHQSKTSEETKPFDRSFLFSLPEKLRETQSVFEQTGGLHASALYNHDGKLIVLREDVGRHNALDKLIGYLLIDNLLPVKNSILLLSGRASFELIQKAAMADIKTVAAIGAPSSLAVELANEHDMTLIGFLKNDRFNIYSGSKRILF